MLMQLIFVLLLYLPITNPPPQHSEVCNFCRDHFLDFFHELRYVGTVTLYLDFGSFQQFYIYSFLVHTFSSILQYVHIVQDTLLPWLSTWVSPNQSKTEIKNQLRNRKFKRRGVWSQWHYMRLDDAPLLALGTSKSLRYNSAIWESFYLHNWNRPIRHNPPPLQ